jgi:alpha-N-arabinofuranosidase
VPASRSTVDVGPAIGTADPRLFGSFVEHLGRGVYGGIFEPGHPTATHEGFRGDVLQLVAELGVTVVRYPGGNFVSGYDWRDGIGPREARPRRLDLAWKSIETNEFGTDEFASWCRAAGVEPMLAMNLGLGDLRSAVQLLEYVNHPSGTALSDERAANGAADPHDVRLWCLGNELDGPWQLGQRSAEDYAELAANAANAMRMFDPTLEIIAVGSSHAEMPTFGSWERAVLRRTADLVDYLSCHIYFYDRGDRQAFLRSADRLDEFLDEVAAIIREIRDEVGGRDIRISLDEWNVWDSRSYDDIKHRRGFEVAPRLLEQEYTQADAVVVGTLLQSILGHADVVSIAAQAQLVNVIGPIRAEPGGPAWRQTIFHPFAAIARAAGHTVLSTHLAAGGDPDLVTTVTHSPDGQNFCVFVANRGTESPIELDLALDGLLDGAALDDLAELEVESAELLWHADSAASNTAAEPDRVTPQPLAVALGSRRLRVMMPPLSWASIRLVRRAGRG